MCLVILKNAVNAHFDGIHSCLVSIDTALWLLKPIKVLLLKDKAIWSLSDEVIVFVHVLVYTFELTKNLQSSSEVSLFDFVLAILIILI